MAGKIPKWEADLWYYVSCGNGEHCPLLKGCQTKLACGWCPDANKERLNEFLDKTEEITVHSLDFIKVTEPAQLGRIFLLVELMAQKYLELAKVRCLPVPAMLIGLIDPRGITEVRQVPLKVYHGAIWRPKEGWIIQVRADDSPAMQRFTMFHEAFHILAHCKTSPVFRKRGAIRGSFNELLADYFATCILMPRRWVRERWAEVNDLDRMAEIFNAPKTAICIRLKTLGLV
jgi:hypothetical protein